MGVKVIFGCERCDARPDRATQRTLERHLRDRTLGQFFDAQPGGWLTWTAGGPFGSRSYACAEHRAELVARVRRHYGGRGGGVWADEPYPSLWPHGFSGFDERELAELLAGARRETAARREPVAPRSQRPPRS